MIDHVSLGVRDLARSTQFYEPILATLGHVRLMSRATTVGFGKTYPEFWLNHRPNLVPTLDSGSHLCLRASSQAQVEAFYESAIAAGARGDGPPGVRPEYHELYFAAFIRDFDEHLVEVVTFLRAQP